MTEKLCTGCWRWKEKRLFTRNRRTRDGYSTRCKLCQDLSRVRRTRRVRTWDARAGQLVFRVEAAR